MTGRPALTVASCYFPVEGDVDQNLQAVLRQLHAAADQGARVVHFCETALSGYAGVDLPDLENFDWDKLHAATGAVCQAARERGVWVLLGSTHRLGEGNKPHNSIYVISDAGQVVERYDKRFCTGDCKPDPELDLLHYSPGDHAAVFEIDGYRCSALICYDYRFPELYRDLKRRDVEVVFQSFHNARRDRQTHEQGNIWIDIVPATMMCRAATNHFWISATNSAAQYSSWASFFVRPDGKITGQLKIHEPGVLISRISEEETYWDASAPWRLGSMNGVLHSGEVVNDPRSDDRTCY